VSALRRNLLAVVLSVLAAGCAVSLDATPEQAAAEQVEAARETASAAEITAESAEAALFQGRAEAAFDSAEQALILAARSREMLAMATETGGGSPVAYSADIQRLDAVDAKAMSVIEYLTPPAMAMAPPPPPPPPAQDSTAIDLLDLGIHFYDTRRGPDDKFGFYTYVAFPDGSQATCAQRRAVARHTLDMLSDVTALSRALGIQDNSLLAGLLIPIHPDAADLIPRIQAEKDVDMFLGSYNYPYARQFVRELGLSDRGVYLLAYPVPFESLEAPPEPDAFGLIDLTGATDDRIKQAIERLRAEATMRGYEYQERPDRLAVAMVKAFETVGAFLATFGATEARASDATCP
jgi:hypothetical protein